MPFSSLFKAKVVVMFVVLVQVLGCVPPPDFPETKALPAGQNFSGVYILNEGQWGYGNASLDYISPDGTLNADVFTRQTGVLLGDVAQSVFIDGDTLFIVVNNSLQIHKVYWPTFRLLQTLNLPAKSSPRQMVRLSRDKAYVTSLTDNSVHIFNPRTMRYRHRIVVENFAEGIAVHENRAYVTLGNYAYPQKNNKIAVIDTVNDAVLTTVSLPVQNPGQIDVDGHQIRVLCRGGYYEQPKISAMVWIDPKSLLITKALYLPTCAFKFTDYHHQSILILTEDSSIVRFNPEGKIDYHYITRRTVEAGPHDLLYGFGFDGRVLWLTNARTGATRGVCYQLDSALGVLGRYPTGLFPGTVFFKPRVNIQRQPLGRGA